jgi:amidase/aspartyl-tRNA(Asn)/glutamyl-tRNA(Gln) amidotransferase subunit A
VSVPQTRGLLGALRAAQHRGDVTAEQLAQRSLDRIAAAAELNAVVTVDAEGSMKRAAEIDELRKSGAELPALAGVPVLIKDNTDVRGLRTTHGSLLHAESAAVDRDDTVTAQLRAAGAVIVGKTNLPEFAMESFTDNLVFGATHNPWRQGRSPGGSSGGSAAALSAGLAAIATGTDGGGSTRIPAALCGLLGLKPTSGVAGSTAARLPIDLSSAAPLAHTVADLRMLAQLTLKPVIGDPSCVRGPETEDLHRPVGRVFAVRRIAGDQGVDAEVEKAFLTAAEHFGTVVGCEVEILDGGVLDAGVDETWATIYAAEDSYALGWEIARQRYDVLDPRIAPWVDKGMATSLDQYLKARRDRCEYVRALDDLLLSDNILLSPTLNTVGLPADGRIDIAPGESVPMDLFNTAALNLTGHPGLSVPAGEIDGMPFGMQVIGPRGRDLWLLEVVDAWERAHPWPLMAPGYQSLIEFTP